MNKLLIGIAVAALGAAFAPAEAQTPRAPAAPGGVPSPSPDVAPAPPVRVRMMTNKVMTRAEVDQHVRKLFAAFDRNRDGFITHDEIDSTAPGGVHRMVMGDPAAMFDRLDTNHDGSISREEFMAMHRSVHEQRLMGAGNTPKGAGDQPMHHMHMFGMGMGGFGRRLFNMADGNGDGRVSLQEAEAAALAHFDRADLNHDGKVTPEERQQAHQMMHPHQPS